MMHQGAHHAQDRCVLLSDVRSIFIEYRQSIGIGILAKTYRKATLRNGSSHGGEILQDRLGRMAELPVRSIAQDLKLTPQGF